MEKITITTTKLATDLQDLNSLLNSIVNILRNQRGYDFNLRDIEIRKVKEMDFADKYALLDDYAEDYINQCEYCITYTYDDYTM